MSVHAHEDAAGREILYNSKPTPVAEGVRDHDNEVDRVFDADRSISSCICVYYVCPFAKTTNLSITRRSETN